MKTRELQERILHNICQENNKRIRIAGISGTALSYLYSNILSELKKPNLIILPTKKAAKQLHKELDFFIHGKQIYEFFPYDISPLSGLNPHKDIIARRISSLYALLNHDNPVIITSFEAILFNTIPKEVFIRCMEFFEPGEEIERDLLIRKLEETGYLRVSLVEEIGDYAVRGNVIDIFCPLYQNPVRLEFWGDTLESIRQFDPFSQRSISPMKEMIFTPCSEVILDDCALKRARSLGKLPVSEDSRRNFSGKEAWLLHFYKKPDSIFEYLPEDTLITFFSFQSVNFLYEKTKKRFTKDVERFRKDASEKGEPFPETNGLFLELTELKEKLNKFQRLELETSGPYEPETRLLEIEGYFDLREDIELRIPQKGTVSLAPLAEKIAIWLNSKGKVVIITRTKEQAARLQQILNNYEVKVDRFIESWKELPPSPGLFICIGNISKGFIWHELGLYVISEDEIFGKKKERHKASKRLIPWTELGQFKEGDLVVHEEHGIGRYRGLVKIEVNKRINDYVIIEYANDSKLYIPADRVSILQKYIGLEDKEARLDQLGGRSWDITKKKVKRAIRKIAKHLVELYAIRQARKGYAFSPPDHVFREFEATFEHEETPDQIKAIEDVINDMTSEKPMDRLICGDVGFGKTEIAIRAAFKAVMDGKQVAVVVPTTLLAEQHYNTFKKRMEPYHIRVEMLSRFRSRAEQTKIIAEIRSGKIDILIGTHRILQKDIRFAELGLLVIDEEQRFGVRQKEILKKYRATVDVLSLAATPIPRTLHMSLLGVRDISIIDTPPQDRLSVKTFISHYDEDIIAKAIRFELGRGGQVFFVHNRVQTIEDMAERIKRLVPEARLTVAHGQMKERELEKTMTSFLNKEIDVLVCSSIIESGLDIPSANTIIINGVEKLGLAQVYQLRGRVGRSKKKAYAYLLISDPSSITVDGEKRLKALMDFSRLGAGLQLAMHDLKIRGGGNILGYAQSGHISEIGYELYVKLIRQTMAELKGEEWHEDINPEININMPAYLPESYIIDPDLRLNIYRRLSILREDSELNKIKEELIDRFGPMPQEVKNLFDIMNIRITLKKLGINRLDVTRDGMTLTFSNNGYIDPEKIAQLVKQRPRAFRFLSENKLKINAKRITLPDDIPKIRSVLNEIQVSRY